MNFKYRLRQCISLSLAVFLGAWSGSTLGIPQGVGRMMPAQIYGPASPVAPAQVNQSMPTPPAQTQDFSQSQESDSVGEIPEDTATQDQTVSVSQQDLLKQAQQSSQNEAANKNPSTANFQHENKNGSKKELWNLKDVDIRTLINEVSLITRKDFIVAPDVDAKVTFIAKQSLSPDELYQAFLAVLRTYGYVAIPEGKVIKIVSDKTPNRLSGPLTLHNMREHGSEMVVTTIRVKNYPVNDLIRVIQPLMPKYSFIDVYRPSNSLIIADHADNIKKIQELVASLDTPPQDQLDVIHLKKASASDLVVNLSKLFVTASNSSNARVGLQLAADDHTNSILMYGGTSDQRLAVKAAAAKLDLDYSTSRDNMEVFYLRYIPAETVATVLQGVIDNYLANLPKQEKLQAGGASASTQGASQNYTPTPRSTTGLFNIANPAANYSSSSGGGGSGGSTFGESIQSGKTFVAPRSGSLGPNLQWEESTNSVIVTGPTDLINKCRKVVSKLDIRLPQVLIEVVIAEVDLNAEKDLGVEWSTAGTILASTRFGGAATPTSMKDATGKFPAAAAIGTLGNGLTLGFLSNNNLQAVVRAIHSDSRSNIMATPNLITLDNQEATIKVGTKVSFATSQINNNPTGGNPLTTFDREDVGLILVLKPQITPNGEVKLLIQQELSSILPDTGVAGNPNTSERFITTTVMAKNGQTLVLGGLLQNQVNNVRQKVPVLGDIPILGALFRSDQRTMNKTNLMIFMRPVVLMDDRSVDKVTGGKYEYLRQQQLRADYIPSDPIVSPVAPQQREQHFIRPGNAENSVRSEGAQRVIKHSNEETVARPRRIVAEREVKKTSKSESNNTLDLYLPRPKLLPTKPQGKGKVLPEPF
ncbi:MAG: type II secretion system secretin GspD [Gammaproteobacteria bacterium]|nr:type II secretion system secretin GspD [Gammaproteobacteria bacterium]